MFIFSALKQTAFKKLNLRQFSLSSCMMILSANDFYFESVRISIRRFCFDFFDRRLWRRLSALKSEALPHRFVRIYLHQFFFLHHRIVFSSFYRRCSFRTTDYFDRLFFFSNYFTKICFLFEKIFFFAS